MSCSRWVLGCRAIICIVFFSCLPVSINAQVALDAHRDISRSGPSPQIFHQMMLPPDEVSIKAKSAVLMDALTGEILLAHNPELRIAPASFAKLLTLYVIFDALKDDKLRLDERVHISKKAWKTSGSKMFVEVQTKVPVAELLKGIAVVSGNDASVAMAEHLYGDTGTFTRVMNKYAQNLGMTHTDFANPHGLPHPEQFTTAYDMALLARYYVTHFPQALKLHKLQEYTYAGIAQRNRNGLLKRDPTVDGLKTGWVVKSGYNLVATAMRNGHRLIAVVMGARTAAIREQETLKLLTYGYQNFTLVTFASEGEVMTELPVWQGIEDVLPVVVAKSSAMVLPREYMNRVHTRQVIPQEVVAPVELGQVLGKLLVTIGTDSVRSVPLIAGVGIQPAGIVKRIWHYLYRNGLGSTGSWLAVIGSGLAVCVAVATVVVIGKKFRRRFSFQSRLVGGGRLARGRFARSRLTR